MAVLLLLVSICYFCYQWSQNGRYVQQGENLLDTRTGAIYAGYRPGAGRNVEWIKINEPVN